MIKKIRIENFMSHRDTILEPAEGVTLISGPNNCGKSAVMMALWGLSGLNEVRGDFMIRHGEKTATVTVELENEDGPHVIQWKRKKTTAGWAIDDKESNRGAPDNLREILRLPELSDPDCNSRYQLHFADQKAPLFILSSTGSERAIFFAASSDAGYLLRMQDLHKKNVREKNQEKRNLEDEIRSIGEQLEDTKAVVDLDKSLVKLEADFADISQTNSDVVDLESLIRKLDDALHNSKIGSQQNAVYASLTPPPDLDDVKELKSLINAYQRRIDEEAFQTQLLCQVAPLKNPPILEDSDGLQSLIENIQSATRHHEKCQQINNRLASIQPPPDLDDTEELTELISHITRNQKQVDTAEKTHSILGVLSTVPEIDSTEEIERVILELGKKETGFKKAGKLVQEIAENLQSVVTEIESWTGEHPFCPTCGQKVEASTLIDHIEGVGHG